MVEVGAIAPYDEGRHTALEQERGGHCAFRRRGDTLQAEAIEGDPLPPGQVWEVTPGGAEGGPGLYRPEVATGPGAGVKVLNQLAVEKQAQTLLMPVAARRQLNDLPDEWTKIKIEFYKDASDAVFKALAE